jgi:flagellar biosynthetic protein FliP
MPVARAMWWLGLILTMLVVPATELHAQPVANSQRSVTRKYPASLMGKKQAGPGSGVRSSGERGGSAKGVDQGLMDAGFMNEPSGLRKKDSIASALEGSRSVPWSIVLGLTLLTLLPALLLSITPMVRLLVVFHFLRQALGTQTAPSNQILMGLALMMTWFLMQPVLLEVEQTAVAPYSSGTISGMEAMDRGVAPVRRYMLRYAREKDLAVFAAAGMVARPKTKEELPIQVVVPAYILSELKAGFQIGAVLFLPFLLVDLVVASVTTSIGMMQLPPVVISTPLKILLFVMVDGWNLLADQLIRSF